MRVAEPEFKTNITCFTADSISVQGCVKMKNSNISQLVPLFVILFTFTSTHGDVSNYTVGDTWSRGYSPDDTRENQLNQPWLIQRSWEPINPIFEATNSSLSCNDPGIPSSSYIPIAAGSKITAIYYNWLHTVGSTILWLADCRGDCSTLNSTEAKWFKIAERGLLEGNILVGMWFQYAFQQWD